MKRLLFLSIIILSASAAYSQEFSFIGVMGGITFSWPDEISIGGVPEAHWESTFRTGAIAGCAVGFSSKYLALEIDGLFFQKGCRIENFYWDIFRGYTYYRLDEISFPLLFKINLLSGTSPYFLGGYEFSFILSHKGDGKDLTQETKKTDSSLILGVGFRQKIEKGYFYIEGRYQMGLQPLSKDWDFDYFPFREIRSFVLMAGFSYCFLKAY